MRGSRLTTPRPRRAALRSRDRGAGQRVAALPAVLLQQRWLVHVRTSVACVAASRATRAIGVALDGPKSREFATGDARALQERPGTGLAPRVRHAAWSADPAS